MAKVHIKSGSYRQRDVSGTIAELITEYKVGSRGGYITVEGEVFGFPGAKAKVLLTSDKEYEIVDDNTPTKSPEELSPKATAATGTDWSKVVIEGDIEGESETDAIDRINERFEILEELTTGVGKGNIRGLIVAGAPGVGKSFGVEKRLSEMNLMKLMSDTKPNFEFVKGVVTPVMLFMKLFEYSGKDQIIVFDDCDSVFFDGDALNMLKAALDTGKRRFISYNSDSKLLGREGVPNRFEFKGSVIFITNLKPENTRSERVRAHVEALYDRVLSLDLTIDTPRDRFLRVKSVVFSSPILDTYGFSHEEREQIVDYIRRNIGKLKTGISLRTVINLADLMRMKPVGWQHLARNTLLRNR